MTTPITPGPEALRSAVDAAARRVADGFEPAAEFQCIEADMFARMFVAAGHVEPAALIVAVHTGAPGDPDACVHVASVPADPFLSPSTMTAATAYVLRLTADTDVTGDGGRYW